MEKFNEDEIQKKIEEKRKRFIENAHRALGFYDQNLFSSSNEQKKKRSEMMEKEFNKVFDDNGKPLLRYDEEPAKPLILAASKFPENVSSPSGEENKKKEIMETKPMISEDKIAPNKEEEDSLTVEEKVQDLRHKPSTNAIENSVQEVDSMPVNPELSSK